LHNAAQFFVRAPITMATLPKEVLKDLAFMHPGVVVGVNAGLNAHIREPESAIAEVYQELKSEIGDEDVAQLLGKEWELYDRKGLKTESIAVAEYLGASYKFAPMSEAKRPRQGKLYIDFDVEKQEMIYKVMNLSGSSLEEGRITAKELSDQMELRHTITLPQDLERIEGLGLLRAVLEITSKRSHTQDNQFTQPHDIIAALNQIPSPVELVTHEKHNKKLLQDQLKLTKDIWALLSNVVWQLERQRERLDRLPQDAVQYQNAVRKANDLTRNINELDKRIQQIREERSGLKRHKARNKITARQLEDQINCGHVQAEILEYLHSKFQGDATFEDFRKAGTFALLQRLSGRLNAIRSPLPEDATALTTGNIATFFADGLSYLTKQ
ncbi:MAG: hypothetical protein M3R00_04655, partial [Pseudomonadota bacterium]|nr:hypothetical protein [Pseudomonadota bacterium]